MRNVDIEAFPGALKVQKATASLFFATALSATFTADAATDILTISGTNMTDYTTGTAVTVSSTGTLPTGLSASTNYFIIAVSSSTIKLATTIALANAGTAINITDAGSGTHTIATVNPGTVNHIVRDTHGDIKFFHDSNGRVWYLTSGSTRVLLLNGNTLTNSSGQGLAFIRDNNATEISKKKYLFVFRNALIDVVEITGTTQIETPSWTSGWQTMNTGSGAGNSHHALTGQDFIIYYCDGRYIGSIKELTTFDPANSATFTYTSQALDLPQLEIANWLEELGTNLEIAGDTFNFIYPWDRLSNSYNLPIPVPETSIKRLKNIGNLVYILAGTKGNIYTTQGSYVNFAKKLPDYLVNNSGTLQANPVTWGGITSRNGVLLFGVAGLTSGNSGAYILYPDGRLVMDNIPSSGSGNVTALYAQNDFYIMGHASGGSYHTSTRYASYEAVAHSGLYRLSDKTRKGALSTLEVQVAKPVATGHIRIGYRADTSSSFTTIDTYTADGTAISFESDAGLIDLENIQVQVEMDGLFELMEVRLLP
ncbi:hypothetical protein HY967_01575 [Candidatus Jorgensenbacteria bacterium]|nr:hypothetical protein [Candidatus Jorgensenbacteria bacterium]